MGRMHRLGRDASGSCSSSACDRRDRTHRGSNAHCRTGAGRRDDGALLRTIH